MATISGLWEAGEAGKADAAIASALRQRRSKKIYYGLVVVCFGISTLLGWISTRVFELGAPIYPIIAGFGGLILYAIAEQFVKGSRSEKSAPNGQFDTKLPITMFFGEGGLDYTVGLIEKKARWAAIYELFIAKDYWIFVVHRELWVIPRRFFTTVDDEKTFLSEALSHMSEDARERSSGAVKFSA